MAKCKILGIKYHNIKLNIVNNMLIPLKIKQMINVSLEKFKPLSIVKLKEFILGSPLTFSFQTLSF